MRLTRDQILRMAEAVKLTDPDAGDTFYVDNQSDGKVVFGVVEVVEKRSPISLTKVKFVTGEEPLLQAVTN